MESLKRIQESLKLFNGKLDWSAGSNELIKSKFGKGDNFKPYITNLNIGNDRKLKVLSMFKRGDDITLEVLKAIKKTSSSISIDDIAYHNITNRAAIYLARLIKEYSIDYIVTPQSSSNFNNDVLGKFREIVPNIDIFYGAIYKNPNLREITFDNTPGFNANTVANQENDLKKYAESGDFQMKKIHPKFRAYIRNWLKLDSSIANKVNGHNILIFDDYLTTGASLTESSNLLYDSGANNVIAITFLHKN